MIPVFIANATGATILTFDDSSTDRDQGSQFVPQFVTPEITAGQAEYAHLRYLRQGVRITNACTMTIQPIVDDTNKTAVTISPSVTTHPSKYDFDVPFKDGGTRFRLSVSVPTHDGTVALGEHEIGLAVRRSRRGG